MRCYRSTVLLEQLIFFPDSDVPDPPAGVEERWITTEDGLRLHAWYAPAVRSIATLVWSHGNGGNIAGREDVLLALCARGLSVLAYDYRGYGRSEGRPSEAGVYRDARAAYDSERARGVPPATILCFGESLGGAVSIHLACERACAGVAVVSTFTSLADVARKHYGALASLAGKRFESRARLPMLRVPIFVAHGDADELVPFALGEALYAAAPEPKRFFRAAGAHHNDVFAAPGLLDAIAEFARVAVAEAGAGAMS
ncbi:MAG: alpha/beta hydrolase [Deltaproteobacteria bacterium]|nr:alpha/beta hydrolase [Deltaproteobacteria bacterium]